MIFITVDFWIKKIEFTTPFLLFLTVDAKKVTKFLGQKLTAASFHEFLLEGQ